MTFFKRLIQPILKFLNNKKGNAQLLLTASAILASMGIYLFVAIYSLNESEKERTAHLYNAYQMGLSIDALIRNRLFTKGELEINFKDQDGNNRFNSEEFKKYTELNETTVFNLQEMIDDGLINPAPDPTATRLNDGILQEYDREKSKIKVVFDLVIDHYDENGIAVKKVNGVEYFVNLAGQEVTTNGFDNEPYDPGSSFYYLVSFVDTLEGLEYEDITLRHRNVIYNGVLDTETFGTGPVPNQVIVLPGERSR